tara:strand:- start:18813 stop:19358 length:546 start_codon:yes stop_codon:yes gene_type:complete
MKDISIIKTSLNKESKIYFKMLKDELEFQKHMASGKLADGFYARVEQKGDTIVMKIMNNTSYMWKVNGKKPNGTTRGVSASFSDLLDWARRKEARGELSFFSEYDRIRFIAKVKTELEDRYLTRGGESSRISPRRYFFINVVVGQIKDSDLDKKLEDSINKQIIKNLGLNKKQKVVKINIG